MYYIEYPQTAGFFAWEELGCLARALGFQKELFTTAACRPLDDRSPGMTYKETLQLVQMKYLDAAMHHTVNAHTGAYNAKVVKVALDLVNSRQLSFQEIHDARVAFYLYENDEDHDGIVLLDDISIIMRAIKFCGKTVSPQHLDAEIRRVTNNVRLPCRLSLYEFLLVLPICIRVEDIKLKSPEGVGRDSLNMFNLCDFDELLQPSDSRRVKKLDEMYREKLRGSKVLATPGTNLDFPAQILVKQEIIDLSADSTAYKNSLSQARKEITRAKYGRPTSAASRPTTASSMSSTSNSTSSGSRVGSASNESVRSIVPSRVGSAPATGVRRPLNRSVTHARLSTERIGSSYNKTNSPSFESFPERPASSPLNSEMIRSKYSQDLDPRLLETLCAPSVKRSTEVVSMKDLEKTDAKNSTTTLDFGWWSKKFSFKPHVKTDISY